MSIKDEIIHALGGITYEEHMKKVQDSRDSLDFAAETYERAFRSLNEKVEQYRGVLDILTEKFNQACGSNLKQRDMSLVYDALGNKINPVLTLKFVRSGFDMAVLS